MKRRLFTILSALSLLLFVAVCVLWVRSYMLSDRIRDRTFIGSSSLVTEVQSGLGVLGVQLYLYSYAPTGADETRARFEGHPLLLEMRHRKPWAQRPNFYRMRWLRRADGMTDEPSTSLTLNCAAPTPPQRWQRVAVVIVVSVVHLLAAGLAAGTSPSHPLLEVLARTLLFPIAFVARFYPLSHVPVIPLIALFTLNSLLYGAVLTGSAVTMWRFLRR